LKLVLHKGVWTLVVRPSNSWWILFLLCMDEIFHFVCMASYFTRPYLVCLNHLLKLQWLFLVLRLKFLLCTLIVHRFTDLARPCTGLSKNLVYGPYCLGSGCALCLVLCPNCFKAWTHILPCTDEFAKLGSPSSFDLDEDTSSLLYPHGRIFWAFIGSTSSCD